MFTDVEETGIKVFCYEALYAFPFCIFAPLIVTLNTLGFNNQSNYSSQGGGGGGGSNNGNNSNNQGFGANHSQYHSPVGYGRGESSMNYQYR